MESRTTFTLISVLILAGLSGCGEVESTAPVTRVAPAQEKMTYVHQTSPRLFLALVGKGLNGRRLTGQMLEGHYVSKVSLDGVELDDGRLEALALQATSFRRHGHGHRQDRRASRVTGAERGFLEGARFSSTLDDGSTLPLRVDEVVLNEDPSDGLVRYVVSYPSQGEWLPLCGVDAEGEPVLAMPLNGAWDYREGVEGGGDHIADDRSFTFGCEGYVLAKCVEMGYEPWSEGWLCDDEDRGRGQCEPYGLASHHQACTRMLRADFCGDGTSSTEDGTLINAYDGVGIRYDSEDWPFEAEWDEDGAICVSRERLESEALPHCWTELFDPEGCGAREHFLAGTLLMSEDLPL